MGDTCVEIKSLKKGVDSKVYNINTNTWKDDEKNFCGGDSLRLRKLAREVDLCAFADREVDFEVSLKGTGGENLIDFGSIKFPGPNAVPGTPAPTAAPTIAPSKVCSVPEGFTFKLNRTLCGSSSNSQGIQRSTGRKLSKGKGSNKTPATCAGCVDHYVKVTTMDPPPLVTVYSKDCENNKKTMLKKGTMKFFDDPDSHNTNPPTFIFKPNVMPNCVVIEIREITNGYAKKSQTVSFDTTCSNGNRLSVGDSFGAVEIVDIN